MTGHDQSGEQPDLRVAIDPEPTDEEFVAIMQALQALMGRDAHVTPSVQSATSNWTRVARRETLRTAEWPQQRNTWESGSR